MLIKSINSNVEEGSAACSHLQLQFLMEDDSIIWGTASIDPDSAKEVYHLIEKLKEEIANK